MEIKNIDKSLILGFLLSTVSVNCLGSVYVCMSKCMQRKCEEKTEYSEKKTAGFLLFKVFQYM